MPRGTKVAKKQPVKKVKQIDNGIYRNLDGGHIEHKPLIDLQFNVPKGVADDKKVRPNQVFEGYKKTKQTKKKK
jgi:hypothetical protein